jgi:ABC-type transport system substrate-binding protein
MKLSGWQSLAVSSLLLSAFAKAELRPQYGRTLHVATRIALSSLDPADDSQPDTVARRNLTRLMFDTLVTMDSQGRAQPSLATSWQVAPGNQRWQFHLQRGVRFQDGSPLTPEAIAASLRVANPEWNVSAGAESVTIERQAPDPDLTAELSRARNGIAKRSGGNVVGTGPFGVTDWQPGKKLSLSAQEGYWGGRAFVDAIEIEMDKSTRDQLIELELGKTDIAEVATEQVQRVSAAGRRVVTSASVEEMALVFARDLQSPEEGKLREALALSIDRESIRTVVLQGVGEPSAAILPNWVSGYAFIYPATQNLERARRERSEVQHAPSWTLGYDTGDPVARVIAERIALNARDAGIALQTTTAANADLRLTRLVLASANAHVALRRVARSLGLPEPKLSNSVEDLYQAETAILQTQRLVPLFQLPTSYALSPNVQDWNQDRDGTWHLEDVWLGNKP